MDMFGFSVVVAAATCDLQLGIVETGILASAPFAGSLHHYYDLYVITIEMPLLYKATCIGQVDLWKQKNQFNNHCYYVSV